MWSKNWGFINYFEGERLCEEFEWVVWCDKRRFVNYFERGWLSVYFVGFWCESWEFIIWFEGVRLSVYFWDDLGDWR